MSDEDVLKKLYIHTAMRRPSKDELEAVMKSVEEICKLTSKKPKKIAEQAQQLKTNLISIDKVRTQLKEEKGQLELRKGKLENETQEIGDEISVVKQTDAKVELEILERRYDEAQEQLREVCKQLSICIQQLKEADADYDSVSDQLNICRKNLNSCKNQLKACDDHLKNSDTGIAMDSGIKGAIGEAFGEIGNTFKTISEIQDILDSAEPKDESDSDPAPSDSDVGKTNQTSAEVQPAHFLIWVQSFTGHLIALTVKRSDTVGTFKEKIKEKIGIPSSPDNYYLIQILQEEHVLSDYYYIDKTRLQLVQHSK